MREFLGGQKDGEIYTGVVDLSKPFLVFQTGENVFSLYKATENSLVFLESKTREQLLSE